MRASWRPGLVVGVLSLALALFGATHASAADRPVASRGQFAAADDAPRAMTIIDLQPFTLDMVVPDYLPARDLTQRVARDAGLGGFWEDGTRRKYYLRARGRLLNDDEKLKDLGVVICQV